VFFFIISDNYYISKKNLFRLAIMQSFFSQLQELMMSYLRRFHAVSQSQPYSLVESGKSQPDTDHSSMIWGADCAALVRGRIPKAFARLSLGTMAIALGVTGLVFYHPTATDTNSRVWISGIQVSQSEASYILAAADYASAVQQAAESDSTQPASAIQTDRAAIAPAQANSQIQPIEFAPNTFSTTIQGSFQDATTQSYVLKAAEGQTLMVVLHSSDAVITLLRPDHQQVDAAAYQTLNWTGRLPVEGNYLIQVTGSGAYTLEVAIAP
jgi:hypothetical protein